MKQIILTLLGGIIISTVFSQANVTDQKTTNKIVLAGGQKILVETNITMEASLSPGMDMTGNTSSANTLEMKTGTDSSYTISNTLTKVKLNMDMMGQSNSFDSDKKEDKESEIGKGVADKLNKPVDISINKLTGKILPGNKTNNKKSDDQINGAGGLLGIFSGTAEDAVVSEAFSLLPQGKKVGDNWTDSTIEKNNKVVRVYTLRSINDKEAIIQLDIVTEATTTIEQQGMSMDFTSITKTKTDITTDIITGLVKTRTSQSDISGSMQVMGQSMPITAKTTSTSTYK